MRQYLEALRKVLTEGEMSPDRTGTGTVSLFGDIQLAFDLREGFPIQTTKRVSFKNVAAELLWFLSGSTDLRPLIRDGVNIWTADWKRVHRQRGYTDEQLDSLVAAVKAGQEEPHWDPDIFTLYHVYGEQWRQFGEPFGKNRVDQIDDLLDSLKDDPHSRRHIVCAWNPLATDKMALPPCHTMFQMHVSANGRFLDCKMYQRSGDMVLGVPYNIASYALLTHLVARHTGLTPRKLVITLGDAHVYRTHMDAAMKVLERTPGDLPQLVLDPRKNDLYTFQLEDMHLEGYSPQEAVYAPLEVGK
jgi:thymidylate synthase